MNKDELLLKANTLPQEPGCYLMRDKDGIVIYVGKAKRLKARVTSYFNNSAKSSKTESLVSHIVNFDFFITNSEVESLVLENNLIKEHWPKYNIRLRDDKGYPYVQVNWNEPAPRLEYARKPRKGKNIELYGPFPTGSNIGYIIRVLTKTFGFRDCTLKEFKSRKTPCLLYQMHQCTAPCVKIISPEKYNEQLKFALGFFQGKTKATKVIEYLKSKMQDYAEKEEFERASIMRDNVNILKEFLEKSFEQKVEFLNHEKNIDVWSFFSGETEVDMSVYMVRSGMLIGNKTFNFAIEDLMNDLSEEVVSKILQYYATSEDLSPEQVVIDFPEKEVSELSAAFNAFGIKQVFGKVKKYQPLLTMTQKHAMENQRVRILNNESVYVGLNKLKELLKLKDRPKLLECFDIAIWQGQSPTAAQIVFEEGKPVKADYRYYHLKVREEGNNDFAMMAEVIARRIKKLPLPDIFIIDGGIGQVNAVKEVLDKNQILTPVIGIAKSKDLTSGNYTSKSVVRTEERLIIPGRLEPYILTQNPALFRIIVSMRDEAHRFSRKLHHHAEHKRVLSTWVDQVPGIGAKVKTQILSQLEMGKDELVTKTISQLMEIFSITSRDATKLKEYLSRK